MEIQKTKSLPTVVLVGRMNVGKSTLFNRLTASHGALVSDIPGTTRDRREGIVTWQGQSFALVDTGGIDLPKTSRELKKQKKGGYSVSSDPFASVIEAQAARARKDAALILFIVDGREGLLPQERTWMQTLKKEKKPVILAVNKIDAPKQRHTIHEFWTLGCGEPHAISATTGAGTGDLLEHIIAALDIPARTEPGEAMQPLERPIRIALLGRPNVGKSSLVNAILGEDRVIVSPIAHTTREPIDTAFIYNDHPYVLVDTAGIRKKAHVDRGLEHAGVALSLTVLKRTDVVLFVLESHLPLGVQDLHLGRALAEEGVGCIIIANKWDLFLEQAKHRTPGPRQGSGRQSTIRRDAVGEYTTYIRNQLPHLSWAPILFVSALTKRNVHTILEEAAVIQRERGRTIPQEELDQFMKKLVYRPSTKNKTMRKPHIYALKQTGSYPPTFELVTEWTNVMTQKGKQKGTVRDSYVRFIENRFREKFGFEGVSITLKLRTIEQ